MPGVRVDPPPLTVQLVDPRTGMATRFARDFLHRLWLRTGGNTDAVTGTDPQRYQSLVGQLYGQTEEAPRSYPFVPDEEESPPRSYSVGFLPDETEIINATADFTTTGNQVIICTNSAGITITLNPNPDDGERVTIKRQNGGVFVSGLIDGTTGKRIANRYSAPQLIYTLAAGEWSII